jgi:hypothetical protein
VPVLPDQDEGESPWPVARVLQPDLPPARLRAAQVGRPSVVQALANDISTIRMRAVIRQEIWAALRELGLVQDAEPPPQSPRKRPALRVVEVSDEPS